MTVEIRIGDCRELLAAMPDQSVHCCVTSPPYFGLRDYGVAGQIGLEPTPDAYVAEMVAVFREVRRVLRDDGTLWLNLGDSYANTPVGSFNGGGFKDKSAQTGGRDLSGVETSGLMNKFKASGLKQKDLIGIPWRVAFALQADGWYLRSEIIWHKPNPMPESVTDRPTKSHEQIFLLSKSPRYFYDADAIAEPSAGRELFGNIRSKGHCEQRQDNNRRDMTPTTERNRRSVWTVATQPFSEAHFATFPPALIEPCILAGCPKGGTVLDPFGGAGTTGLVADRLGRNAILLELNPEYAAMARRRIESDAGMFASVA